MEELLELYEDALDKTDNGGDCFQSLCDNGFFKRFRALVETTAYVVPKCPHCKESYVVISINTPTRNRYGPTYTAYCDSCDKAWSFPRENTPAKAAAAFSDPDHKS